MSENLIDIPDFVIQHEGDVVADGIFLYSEFVEDGRRQHKKVFVPAADIHKHLRIALGQDKVAAVYAEVNLNPEKTPTEWCRELGARILDHDGWRGIGAPDWHTPITRSEFDRRLNMCTYDATGYPEFAEPVMETNELVTRVQRGE